MLGSTVGHFVALGSVCFPSCLRRTASFSAGAPDVAEPVGSPVLDAEPEAPHLLAQVTTAEARRGHCSQHLGLDAGLRHWHALLNVWQLAVFFLFAVGKDFLFAKTTKKG